jgi:hypothetical protein
MSKRRLKSIYYLAWVPCTILGLCIYGSIVYASIRFGISKKSIIADKLVEVLVLGVMLWFADRAGKAACCQLQCAGRQKRNSHYPTL